MSHSPAEPKRNFSCDHCQKTVTIPANLPATTGPCPHCGETITSPEPQQAALAGPSSGEKSPQTSPAPKGPPAGESGERRAGSSSAKWLLAGVACLVGLGAVAVVGKLLLSPQDGSPSSSSGSGSLSVEAREANAFQQRGWVPEAQKALNGFFAAKNTAERARWTLSEASTLEQFYRDFPFDERDTGLDSFSPVSLGKEDTSRGLFLMNYNRPSQFAITEFFRPIPPLRVRHGLEAPDALLMGEATLDNFVEESVRVMAFFRREEDGRMLLDWETFVQTKHRLLRQFVENPVPGKRGVFRVFVQEDVDFENRDGTGVSVFRLSDPANQDDYAKVLVNDASELGRAFAPLKWRGRAVRVAPKRNGTVTLVWTDDPEPQLQLGGLICWQFVGLGGEPGNWKEELAAREEAQARDAGE